MKRPLGVRDWRRGNEKAERELWGRPNMKGVFSFREVVIYSIHKRMLVADILSWVLLAVLMWGLKRPGGREVVNLLRRLRLRSLR